MAIAVPVNPPTKKPIAPKNNAPRIISMLFCNFICLNNFKCFHVLCPINQLLNPDP